MDSAMWYDSLFPKEWTIRKSSRLPTLFLEEESASNCHLTGWDTSCPNMHANMRSPHAKGRHSSCHHTKTNRAPQAGDYSTHLRVEAFRLQLMLQEVFMPYLFFFFLHWFSAAFPDSLSDFFLLEPCQNNGLPEQPHLQNFVISV